MLAKTSCRVLTASRLSLCVTLAVFALAIAGWGKQRGGALPVPFPYLQRTAKFPVARLSRQHFIEMGASKTILPKGYADRLKKDQNIIQLSYGYKSGGIVRVFETPQVPKVDPVAFISGVNEDGFFPNVKRGDWKLKAVVVHGVFVVCGSENPLALDLAVQEFKTLTVPVH